MKIFYTPPTHPQTLSKSSQVQRTEPFTSLGNEKALSSLFIQQLALSVRFEGGKDKKKLSIAQVQKIKQREKQEKAKEIAQTAALSNPEAVTATGISAVSVEEIQKRIIKQYSVGRRISYEKVCNELMGERNPENLALVQTAFDNLYERGELSPVTKDKTKAWRRIVPGQYHHNQSFFYQNMKSLENIQDPQSQRSAYVLQSMLRLMAAEGYLQKETPLPALSFFKLSDKRYEKYSTSDADLKTLRNDGIITQDSETGYDLANDFYTILKTGESIIPLVDDYLLSLIRLAVKTNLNEWKRFRDKQAHYDTVFQIVSADLENYLRNKKGFTDIQLIQNRTAIQDTLKFCLVFAMKYLMYADVLQASGSKIEICANYKDFLKYSKLLEQYTDKKCPSKRKSLGFSVMEKKEGSKTSWQLICVPTFWDDKNSEEPLPIETASRFQDILLPGISQQLMEDLNRLLQKAMPCFEGGSAPILYPDVPPSFMTYDLSGLVHFVTEVKPKLEAMNYTVKLPESVKKTIENADLSVCPPRERLKRLILGYYGKDEIISAEKIKKEWPEYEPKLIKAMLDTLVEEGMLRPNAVPTDTYSRTAPFYSEKGGKVLLSAHESENKDEGLGILRNALLRNFLAGHLQPGDVIPALKYYATKNILLVESKHIDKLTALGILEQTTAKAPARLKDPTLLLPSMGILAEHFSWQQIQQLVNRWAWYIIQHSKMLHELAPELKISEIPNEKPLELDPDVSAFFETLLSEIVPANQEPLPLIRQLLFSIDLLTKNYLNGLGVLRTHDNQKIHAFTDLLPFYRKNHQLGLDYAAAKDKQFTFIIDPPPGGDWTRGKGTISYGISFTDSGGKRETLSQSFRSLNTLYPLLEAQGVNFERDVEGYLEKAVSQFPALEAYRNPGMLPSPVQLNLEEMQDFLKNTKPRLEALGMEFQVSKGIELIAPEGSIVRSVDDEGLQGQILQRFGEGATISPQFLANVYGIDLTQAQKVIEQLEQKGLLIPGEPGQWTRLVPENCVKSNGPLWKEMDRKNPLYGQGAIVDMLLYHYWNGFLNGNKKVVPNLKFFKPTSQLLTLPKDTDLRDMVSREALTQESPGQYSLPSLLKLYQLYFPHNGDLLGISEQDLLQRIQQTLTTMLPRLAEQYHLKASNIDLGSDKQFSYQIDPGVSELDLKRNLRVFGFSIRILEFLGVLERSKTNSKLWNITPKALDFNRQLAVIQAYKDPAAHQKNLRLVVEMPEDRVNGTWKIRYELSFRDALGHPQEIPLTNRYALPDSIPIFTQEQSQQLREDVEDILQREVDKVYGWLQKGKALPRELQIHHAPGIPPAPLELNRNQFLQFLRDVAPALEKEPRIHIQFPEKLRKEASHLKITTTQPFQASDFPTSQGLRTYLASKQPLKDLQVSLDGKPLTMQQLAEMAASENALQYLMGHWIWVDLQEIRAVYRLLKGTPETPFPTVRDLAHLAQGHEKLEFQIEKTLDDKLKLLKEAAFQFELLELPTKFQLPKPVNGKPFQVEPFQIRGYSWMYYLYQNGMGGILADDPRLGKTLQTLCLLQKICQDKEALKKRLSDEMVALTKAINEAEAFPETTHWDVAQLRRQKASLEKTRINLNVSQEHEKFLVLCPKTAKETWRQQILRFTPELQNKILVAGYEEYESDAFVQAKLHEQEKSQTGATSKKSQKPLKPIDPKSKITQLFQKQTPLMMVVLDEAQRVKNERTGLCQSVKLLTQFPIMALTGTPIENNIAELRTIFELVNPGLFGDKSYFKKEYFDLIEQREPLTEEKRQAREDALARLRLITHPFILRRTDADPEIAEKFPKQHVGVIDGFRNEALPGSDKYDRELMDQDQLDLSAMCIDNYQTRVARRNQTPRDSDLVLTNLLRKIADHPYLIYPNLLAFQHKVETQQKAYEAHSDGAQESRLLQDLFAASTSQADVETFKTRFFKPILEHPAGASETEKMIAEAVKHPSFRMIALAQHLEALLKEGKKAVIYTEYLDMGEILKRYLTQTLEKSLKGRKVLFLHGGTSEDDRKNIIERFDEGPTRPELAADQEPALLISLPKVGSLGITLAAADAVVHFDRGWNPAREKQMNKRVVVLGKTRPVWSYRFMTRNPLDKFMNQVHERKLGTARDALPTEEATIKAAEAAELHTAVEAAKAYYKQALERYKRSGNGKRIY